MKRIMTPEIKVCLDCGEVTGCVVEGSAVDIEKFCHMCDQIDCQLIVHKDLFKQADAVCVICIHSKKVQ